MYIILTDIDNLLLISYEGLPGLFPVTTPLSADELGHRVSDIKSHLKARMMPQLAEHGAIVGHPFLGEKRENR